MLPEPVAGVGTVADAAAFLRVALPTQRSGIHRYARPTGDVWVKKAAPRPPRWRYGVLGMLAGALRLDALRPVRNRGGAEAVATEARRIADLAARGLRVPTVLAVQPGDDGGLLLAHAGPRGERAATLSDEINDAVQLRDGATVLARWQEGLEAIAAVHTAGGCLSQAFARNLVRWADGTVGYIDFEDDPEAELPLAQCQARDLLCYLHSTALYLREAGVLDAAAPYWQRWLSRQPRPLQALLHHSAQRMRWLRWLPADRRLGRDLQRARAAHDVLAGQPNLNAI